jgi:hypothetical protein
MDPEDPTRLADRRPRGQVEQLQAVAGERVILRHMAHSSPAIGVEGESEPPIGQRPGHSRAPSSQHLKEIRVVGVTR